MAGNQGCCHSSSVSQVGNQSFIRMPKWRGFDCQQASGCESPSCWCALFLDVPLPAQYSFFSTRNNDLLVVTELEIDTFFLPFPYVHTQHSFWWAGFFFFFLKLEVSAAVRQYITHKPMLWAATQTKSVQRASVLEGKLCAPYLYFHTLGPSTSQVLLLAFMFPRLLRCII